MISVMVLTRNRNELLCQCLDSLVNQTLKPDQLVVIDNGDGRSLGIAGGYKSKFAVSWFKELRKGESFCRNRAVELANGEVLVFIDDDCVADSTWLEELVRPILQGKADGVLGYSENKLRDNPYACVYQTYYRRWLMENNLEGKKGLSRLFKNNSFFDTKNVAFSSRVLKKYGFDTSVLFRSINVDSVAGSYFIDRYRVIFNRKAVVRHSNWDGLKDLLLKNYYTGVADKLILENNGINNRLNSKKYSFPDWWGIIKEEMTKLNVVNKVVYLLFLLIFPIPYKAGRLTYGNWQDR